MDKSSFLCKSCALWASSPFCLKVVLCGQVPETLSLTVNDYSNTDQAVDHRSAESLK